MVRLVKSSPDRRKKKRRDIESEKIAAVGEGTTLKHTENGAKREIKTGPWKRKERRVGGEREKETGGGKIKVGEGTKE